MNEIITTWWPVVPSVIALAAVIAAITKNEWDNKVVDILRKIVDIIAFNFGGAKNEKKKPD